MNYTRKLSTIMIGALLVLMALSLVPLIPTVSAQSEEPIYLLDTVLHGVIEKDREDYMNAAGNPLHEDIANAVFQGPGPIGGGQIYTSNGEWILNSTTVGYMKDVEINVSNYGTLLGFHYPAGDPLGLPVIEETPVEMSPEVDKAPLEGWFIAYNLTVYPLEPEFQDKGYLIVTYGGYENGYIVPNITGQEADDDWTIQVVDEKTLVDNPRLFVRQYNITLQNLGSRYKPKFELDVIIIFNKATKFVEIFQKVTLVDIDITGCISVDVKLTMGRMVIMDANPYCDRAFYGWKNVTWEDPEEFFIVLSWTNETLHKWVRHDIGYEYYGDYMVAYPVPDRWAIVSTWYGNLTGIHEAARIWNAPTLEDLGLTRYVFLYMADVDNDNKGDGDQALIRVEWNKTWTKLLPEQVLEIKPSIDWKMVMYGVYDVGDFYDGGEGGLFDQGYLALSNGTSYHTDNYRPYGLDPLTLWDVPSTWTHTGTLGYLNTHDEKLITRWEQQLMKYIRYLDVDQDGLKDEDEDYDKDDVYADTEYNITAYWYPTEELVWQLNWKFSPPVFCKELYPTCCKYASTVGWKQVLDDFVTNDFIVLPAPGATPDASGAAWLNGLYTAWLVTFDVEAYNMEATVGYTNPAEKMLPYIMLRLEPIPNSTETYRPDTWKSGRVGHYMTDDLRALPQMEWTDVEDTQWRDVHYFAIAVAGIHPNLLTFYANDFSPIVRPIGGDYGTGYLAILPVGGMVSLSEYIGGDVGAGVIALARDHFNNVYFIVYGLDAQDTYWTAWFATFGLPDLLDSDEEDIACSQAIMIEIDYSDIGHSWGDGTGIPTAHPNYPFVNDEPVFTVLYKAIEHGNLDGDWSCSCYY